METHNSDFVRLMAFMRKLQNLETIIVFEHLYSAIGKCHYSQLTIRSFASINTPLFSYYRIRRRPCQNTNQTSGIFIFKILFCCFVFCVSRLTVIIFTFPFISQNPLLLTLFSFLYFNISIN